LSGTRDAASKREGFAAVARATFNDTVLFAGSISAGSAGLPTLSSSDTEWEVSSKVVIAVSSLTDAVGTTNDDVAGQGVAGTVGTVGISSTGDCTIGTDDELGAGDGSRGQDKRSCVLHVECC
jgi:hypothetical protein